MDDPSDAKRQRTLNGSQMYGYSAGILGQILPSTLINSYLTIFFTYTVGLNPLLVGIGTALGSMVNAISGPVFGYISDKKKLGRLGKRRVFLIYGLPGLILALILVWKPPLTNEMGAYDFGSAVYLWIFIIAFYINYSMIRSPYLALLPDQSQNEKNRVKISSIQGIFSILASVIGILLPMILQSLLDNPAVNGKFHESENGQILLRSLPWIAFVFGLISAAFTVWAFFSVDESHHKSSDSDLDTSDKSKMGAKSVLRSLFLPFRDKAFLRFLLSILALNMGMRLILKDLAPYFELVLMFDGNAFVYFAVGLLPFAGIGFIFWNKKAKSWGLKKTYLRSNLSIALALLSSFGLIFIDKPLIRTTLALITLGMAVFGLVPGYILPNPIISYFTDNIPQELKGQSMQDTGNAAGTYFGSYLFTLNVANAMGDVFLGILLMGTIDGVPSAESPVMIALIMPIAAVMYYISLRIMKKSKLK